MGIVNDRAQVTDRVQIEMGVYRAPRVPCPECGKETKRMQKPGWRICSNKECRHEFDLVMPEER